MVFKGRTNMEATITFFALKATLKYLYVNSKNISFDHHKMKLIGKNNSDENLLNVTWVTTYFSGFMIF